MTSLTAEVRGRTLAGRYRLERELGRGAAASVWLARDRELDRLVAVKLLEAGSQIATPGRFLEEARTLAGLSHPHILQIFDLGLEGETPYLVLEYASGGSLAGRIPVGGLEPAPVLDLAARMVEALDFAHSRGILHRDVKPGNVLLLADREPKLADFGLAKSVHRQARTRTGLVLGTPEFMAPELFEGSPPSPASDLWALGCLVHTALFGHPPFRGTVAEIAAAGKAGALDPGATQSPLFPLLSATLVPAPRRLDGAGLAERIRELQRTLATDREGRSLGGSRDRTPGGRTALLPRPSPPVLAPAEPATRVASSASSSPGGARGSPSSAPPPGGRSPLFLTLPAALALALGLAGPALRPPATSDPPASDPVPLQEAVGEIARELSRTWRIRLRSTAVADKVTELHRLVFGSRPEREAEIHQAEMAQARAGSPVPADLQALEGARGSLPLEKEWSADRTRIASLVADPELPFSLRRDLSEAIQPLSAFDRYFQAWGARPVYQVEPILRSLVPIRVEDLPEDTSDPALSALDGWRPIPEEPIAALPEEPPAGDHLVYHWATRPERFAPVLVHHPENLSSAQLVAMKTFTFTTFQQIDPEPYRDVSLEVPLGQDPAGRYARVAVVLEVGNLLPPDALRIAWNDTLVFWDSTSRGSKRASYKPMGRAEYRVALELPPGALRPGRNRLVVSEVELPGLVHYHGCDLWSVRLVLEPGAGTGRPGTGAPAAAEVTP